MPLTLILLTALIPTLLLLLLLLLLTLHHHHHHALSHLHYLRSNPFSTSHTTPAPPRPHTHHNPCTAPTQRETILAIETAVAEAQFRRWGEEMGWSECRMRIEREGFTELLDGKVG
ncbi:hypothetical protein IMSHALPRED_005127 [Imshaugia aleurites]|uniref:Uncharacterized protein n=1 Tax=Imshaugia aleurites TaxID=172621 RepID=A0A8H3F8B6_9LECA|nr:hypothetical protein IMSHALPRED_005127 [Imshaugia aleurites]